MIGDLSSPCIKLCRLHNGVCIGCNRTQDEIREWYYGNNEVRQRILDRIKMKVNFIKDHEHAQLPVYGTAGAAGADVYSVADYEIQPGEHQLVNTGLLCSIPNGYELQVRPRSGLALKNKITVLNSPGTIDSDYTGKLGVILMNHSDQVFKVSVGDRIAQIVVAPVVQAKFEWSNSTQITERGSGGFGSTGV
jgi:dUTP pyrophosphatase